MFVSEVLATLAELAEGQPRSLPPAIKYNTHNAREARRNGTLHAGKTRLSIVHRSFESHAEVA